MSTLIFRSSDGYYSVWSCRCGCDGLVKVTGIMEHEVGNSKYFYIRGHQAFGTQYEHIGTRYEFVAEALKSVGGAQRAYTPPDVSSTPENATTGLLGALEDALEHSPESSKQDALRELTSLSEDAGGYDWDDDKTPVVHLAWNEWPDDDA
jgi:hypothetical protein